MQVSDLSSYVLHESQFGYHQNLMLKETLGVFVFIMTSVELTVLLNLVFAATTKWMRKGIIFTYMYIFIEYSLENIGKFASIPPKLGEKPYLEKDSVFGHSLFRVLLHWIYGDNVKGIYNAKFLEAIDFAFKKCHFTFVPKAEQLQAIHVVVTGNDGLLNLQQDLASLFATWLFL